jgi:hypothetical protein
MLLNLLFLALVDMVVVSLLSGLGLETVKVAYRALNLKM